MFKLKYKGQTVLLAPVSDCLNALTTMGLVTLKQVLDSGYVIEPARNGAFKTALEGI